MIVGDLTYRLAASCTVCTKYRKSSTLLQHPGCTHARPIRGPARLARSKQAVNMLHKIPIRPSMIPHGAYQTFGRHGSSLPWIES